MFALGNRDETTWRAEEAPALMGILSCSFAVVIFGFVPDLAAAAQLKSEIAWRISALLLALAHGGIIFANVRGRGRVAERGELRMGSDRPAMAVHWIGALLVLVQLVPALGFFTPFLFFAYLLNLLWLLLMSAMAFVLILIAARSREDSR